MAFGKTQTKKEGAKKITSIGCSPRTRVKNKNKRSNSKKYSGQGK